MRHIFFFLLIVMLSPISWGADFNKGVHAYERGDYATALREMTPLAGQGDANAQFYLGFMYSKGQGVEKNLTEAMKWYRKAAEQGNENALNNLNKNRDFELNTRLRCANKSGTAQTEYAAQQMIKACLAKSGFEPESESESDCWFNWFNW
jgi:TPR repeat protein